MHFLLQMPHLQYPSFIFRSRSGPQSADHNTKCVQSGLPPFLKQHLEVTLQHTLLTIWCVMLLSKKQLSRADVYASCSFGCLDA